MQKWAPIQCVKGERIRASFDKLDRMRYALSSTSERQGPIGDLVAGAVRDCPGWLMHLRSGGLAGLQAEFLPKLFGPSILTNTIGIDHGMLSPKSLICHFEVIRLLRLSVCCSKSWLPCCQTVDPSHPSLLSMPLVIHDHSGMRCDDVVVLCMHALSSWQSIQQSQ